MSFKKEMTVGCRIGYLLGIFTDLLRTKADANISALVNTGLCDFGNFVTLKQ